MSAYNWIQILYEVYAEPLRVRQTPMKFVPSQGSCNITLRFVSAFLKPTLLLYRRYLTVNYRYPLHRQYVGGGKVFEAIILRGRIVTKYQQ